MRFYSRFVFICNACFIIAAILRLVEMGRRTRGNFDGAIGFQPLEASLVVLGYSAVFFSAAFVLVMLFAIVQKKKYTIPRWLLWFNMMMFPIEVYYLLFT
ncbi:MAG: hypothetical protein ABIY51_07740 [Ferruginibacter sp.]